MPCHPPRLPGDLHPAFPAVPSVYLVADVFCEDVLNLDEFVVVVGGFLGEAVVPLASGADFHVYGGLPVHPLGPLVYGGPLAGRPPPAAGTGALLAGNRLYAVPGGDELPVGLCERLVLPKYGLVLSLQLFQAVIPAPVGRQFVGECQRLCCHLKRLYGNPLPAALCIVAQRLPGQYLPAQLKYRLCGGVVV